MTNLKMTHLNVFSLKIIYLGLYLNILNAVLSRKYSAMLLTYEFTHGLS